MRDKTRRAKLVDGVNNNVNMAELYKLAKKAEAGAAKTAQTKVDSSMTSKGSVYNNAENKSVNQHLADVKAGIDAYKNNPNLTASQKKELQSLEKRYNEVNNQVNRGASNTQDSSSNGGDNVNTKMSAEEGKASASSAKAAAKNVEADTEQTNKDSEVTSKLQKETNKENKAMLKSQKKFDKDIAKQQKNIQNAQQQTQASVEEFGQQQKELADLQAEFNELAGADSTGAGEKSAFSLKLGEILHHKHKEQTVIKHLSTLNKTKLKVQVVMTKLQECKSCHQELMQNQTKFR